jgi:hypothetical protein
MQPPYDDFPTAKATRDENSAVIANCPICGNEHRHGWSIDLDKGDRITHRRRHCDSSSFANQETRNNAPRGYYIVPA